MKLTIPGILVTALIVASPALAQNSYSGTTSTPGASVKKDDSATTPMRSKKQTASSKVRHHAKAMSSKPQTTGAGSTSAPGASVNKQ